MSSYRETNPHFEDPQQPQHQVPLPQAQHGQRPHRHHQKQNAQPQHRPSPSSPTQQPPHHHSPGPPFPAQLQETPPSQPHQWPEAHFPLHSLPLHSTQPLQPEHSTQPLQPEHPTQPLQPHRPTPQHSTQPVQPHRPTTTIRMPPPHKTGPHTWLIGAFCALFWIAVFLGGIVVLIVYLVFRPRSPKFDLSGASLNVAYLDMGYLLNADMTLLANFTNPSKKATVDFSYMVVNLYYGSTLIATSYVDPFSAMQAESRFRNVHLVSSQVRLSAKQSQRLQQQIYGNRIRFDVKGLLRTRSNLGSVFRYSYWLYGHCIIEVTGPPSGVLVGKKCTTKR